MYNRVCVCFICVVAIIQCHMCIDALFVWFHACRCPWLRGSKPDSGTPFTLLLEWMWPCKIHEAKLVFYFQSRDHTVTCQVACCVKENIVHNNVLSCFLRQSTLLCIIARDPSSAWTHMCHPHRLV